MDEIQRAQVEAAENVVVQGLRKKGLLPPEPPYVGTPHPAELGVMVVCNPCGSIIRAQWVVREEDPKQAILCVEKCPCDAWLPIETAPLNESVLIFIPNLLAEHYGPAIYRGLCVESYRGERVWKVSGLHSGRDCGADYWPTLWMPLPDPPEVKS